MLNVFDALPLSKCLIEITNYGPKVTFEQKNVDPFTSFQSTLFLRKGSITVIDFLRFFYTCSKEIFKDFLFEHVYFGNLHATLDQQKVLRTDFRQKQNTVRI